VFLVFLSKNAEKGLQNAEPKLRARLEEALDFLAQNPVPIHDYDVLKLTGKETAYRIRIGRYRIQYNVDWNAKTIQVFDIDWRKDSSYK